MKRVTFVINKSYTENMITIKSQFACLPYTLQMFDMFVDELHYNVWISFNINTSFQTKPSKRYQYRHRSHPIVYTYTPRLCTSVKICVAKLTRPADSKIKKLTPFGVFNVTSHMGCLYGGYNEYLVKCTQGYVVFSLFWLRYITFENTSDSFSFILSVTLLTFEQPYGCHNAHYNDVIMGTIASQITNLAVVYSIVYSDADQRKHQSSASLAFVRGNHRGPVNSPHKWPVTRKMFPIDGVIMELFIKDLSAASYHNISLKMRTVCIIACNIVYEQAPGGITSSLIWHTAHSNKFPL